MKKLFNWLKRQNEYLLLIPAVLLFFYSPVLLRKIDPTAAAYDIGVLQLDILAIIRFCVFQVIVWLALKLNWPYIRQYFENSFNIEFFNLQPWERIKISLSVYFALLAALVLASKVI